jgi:hypothetical protein
LGLVADPVEFGDRLLQVPLVAEVVGQIVVRLGEVGLEPDRLTVFLGRLYLESLTYIAVVCSPRMAPADARGRPRP